MDFEIIKSARPKEDPRRFAVGKDTGTLYFVPDILNVVAGGQVAAIVVIGRGLMEGKNGKHFDISVSELLPPGTTIKITT